MFFGAVAFITTKYVKIRQESLRVARGKGQRGQKKPTKCQRSLSGPLCPLCSPGMSEPRTIISLDTPLSSALSLFLHAFFVASLSARPEENRCRSLQRFAKVAPTPAIATYNDTFTFQTSRAMQQHEAVSTIDGLQHRIDDLQKRAAEVPAARDEVLPLLCQELRTALEELLVADEELRQQNEEVIAASESARGEHERYLDLFDFAPDGYPVTNAEGVISGANLAAEHLFRIGRKFLIGKPLGVLVASESRLTLCILLTCLCQGGP